MTAVILLILVLPLVALTLFFALELLVGLGRTKTMASAGMASASAVVVIPAHDEEAGIAATIAALRTALPPLVDLLVVADNSTDRTAELARAQGAFVIVRDDPEVRGKGHALAFARDHLLRSPPPLVVVIVDADCRIDARDLSILIAATAEGELPSQAVNLLRADLTAAPFVQMSNLAFMIKNLVRQRGLQKLAGRVHLTGTGMALPWPIFAHADFGGSSIVEDLALGIFLSEQGKPPQLIEHATIWSNSASSKGTLEQRRRWEGGFITTALPVGLRALVRSVGRFDRRGMAAALDLCVPPVALLVMLDMVALSVCAVAVAFGVSVVPFMALFASACLAAAAVVLCWVREGRAFASPSTIISLPYYLLRKLPLYAGIIARGKPRAWVRTERNP